ncbi:MerR family transcriptional regulator [Pseudonocardia sp. TRM90224]|uniref:MerR family transcriptional regulator n=1 Tax=Pseudonocardia sp. TRM90224 TaxID=2812678 RepID=UPI001E316771|nr:MerR family transcriptional regulator [Pseudonocardia sp. TRM90224]
MTEEKYISSTQLARALGLSPRSIQRYVQQKSITPEFVTPGGHYRWNAERVKEQLKALRERRED